MPSWKGPLLLIKEDVIMKKILLSIVATGLLVFAGSLFAAGPVKIGVFNLQTVLQDTPQLKAIQNKLTKQFTARNNAVIAQQKQLVNDINRLRSMPVAKTGERSDLQVKIINESSDLRAKRTVLEHDVLVARNQNLVKMMAKIRDKAAKIASKKGYDLILANNNVAYSTNSTDVTQDLIKALK